MENERKRSKDDQLFLQLIKTGTILLVLSIVVLVVAFRLDQLENKEQTIVSGLKTEQTGFSIEVGEADRLTPLGADLLIKTAADQINLLNVYGEIEFAHRVTLNDPHIIVHNDRALLYDLQGHYYCMLSPEGIIFEGQTENTIEGAVWSENGHIALTLSPLRTRGSILVIDEMGHKVFEWISRETGVSGYIISASFGPGDRFIDVSMMNTDGAGIRPILRRFSLESAEIGKETLLLQPDLPSALPLIAHPVEGHIWMSDGKKIYDYNEEEGVIRVIYEFHMIRSMQAYNGGVAVTAAHAEGGGMKLFVLKGSSKDIDSGIDLSEEPMTPVVNRGYLALGDGDRLLLIRNGDLSHAKEILLTEPVLRLGVGRNGDLLGVSSSFVVRLSN